MFEKMTTEGLEQESDRLGGYQVLESGLYDGTIKLAYVTNSNSSDAKCVNLVVDYDGFEFTERHWVLSGKGVNYYEKNKKKFMLPSFEQINSLCLLATGHPLAEQDVEEKTIDLWDNDQKKDVPTNVPVITSILGKPISAGILKQIVNKQEKDESTGKWHDTNDERTENVTDKFFHTESKRTVAELKKGGDIDDEDLFYTKWGEKNTGETRNKFKPVTDAGTADGGSSGSGSPKSKGNKSKSLFS